MNKKILNGDLTHPPRREKLRIILVKAFGGMQHYTAAHKELEQELYKTGA